MVAQEPPKCGKTFLTRRMVSVVGAHLDLAQMQNTPLRTHLGLVQFQCVQLFDPATGLRRWDPYCFGPRENHSTLNLSIFVKVPNTLVFGVSVAPNAPFFGKILRLS